MSQNLIHLTISTADPNTKFRQNLSSSFRDLKNLFDNTLSKECIRRNTEGRGKPKSTIKSNRDQCHNGFINIPGQEYCQEGAERRILRPAQAYNYLICQKKKTDCMKTWIQCEVIPTLLRHEPRQLCI